MSEQDNQGRVEEAVQQFRESIGRTRQSGRVEHPTDRADYEESIISIQQSLQARDEIAEEIRRAVELNTQQSVFTPYSTYNQEQLVESMRTSLQETILHPMEPVERIFVDVSLRGNESPAPAPTESLPEMSHDIEAVGRPDINHEADAEAIAWAPFDEEAMNIQRNLLQQQGTYQALDLNIPPIPPIMTTARQEALQTRLNEELERVQNEPVEDVPQDRREAQIAELNARIDDVREQISGLTANEPDALEELENLHALEADLREELREVLREGTDLADGMARLRPIQAFEGIEPEVVAQTIPQGFAVDGIGRNAWVNERGVVAAESIRWTTPKIFQFDVEKINNTVAVVRAMQALVSKFNFSEQDIERLGIKDLVVEKSSPSAGSGYNGIISSGQITIT